MPRLARLVVGLATWRTGPDPRLLHVGIVMWKFGTRLDFSQGISVLSYH